MSKLLVKPKNGEGRITHVTPETAGWTYVGFDLWRLKPGETASGGEKGREVCIVFISGKGKVSIGGQGFRRHRRAQFAVRRQALVGLHPCR